MIRANLIEMDAEAAQTTEGYLCFHCILHSPTQEVISHKWELWNKALKENDTKNMWIHTAVWDDDTPMGLMWEQFLMEMYIRAEHPITIYNTGVISKRAKVEVDFRSGARFDPWDCLTYEFVAKLTDDTDMPMFPEEVEDFIQATRIKLGGLPPKLKGKVLWKGLTLDEYMTDSELQNLAAYMCSKQPGSGLQMLVGRIECPMDEFTEDRLQRAADTIWFYREAT